MLNDSNFDQNQMGSLNYISNSVPNISDAFTVHTSNYANQILNPTRAISSIALIEVDSELGAGIQGQSMGAIALMKAVLEKQVASKQTNDDILAMTSLRVKTENWATQFRHRHPYAKCIDQLYQVLNRTSHTVAKTLQAGQFPLILGGDHSTAAGTIAGIKQAFPNKRLGVVWIDAHADIHSPFTTPSGNMHGMPLAIATATDNLEEQINSPDSETIELWEKCKAIGLCNHPNLNLEDLVYVAVRDTEAAEDYFIKNNHILNITTSRLRQLGADRVAKFCLEKLKDVDLIYVSFDVDSLDPTVCRGTGTPSPGGIFLNEALSLNQALVTDPRVCCWEICEINLLLDDHNIMLEYSLSIVQCVINILKKGMANKVKRQERKI